MNDSTEHALCPPAEQDPRPPPAEAPVRAYLDGLNPEQRQAAEALDGPLLVLAGAGTGKTRVLTTRLAHILATRRARPGEVLAVTFTNKAAREMIGRVERLIGRSAAGLWLGTFHAIAARILRRHAELAGLKPDFTILDTDDQIRLLKQRIRAENIDEKRWPARTLSVIIQRWKDRGLTCDKVAGAEGADFANGRAPRLYAAYQERLRTVNAADFGDLLLHNLTLFTKHQDVLAPYQQRFKYLLVDEYQDTNVAQYLWLRLLAQTHHSICCVGDDDQSIYGWRGAEVGNILRFESDFDGARIIRLDGRSHGSLPQWHGDSRAHWEDSTLVVETRNFSDQVSVRGSTANVHLVERFTRVGPDTVLYEFTVDDPVTWTRPWTAAVPLTRTDAPLFEYACHEGNYAMEGILGGARAEERAAAEGVQ